MAPHQLAGTINVDQQQLAALCARHRIAFLRVFGSALTDDFRPESDIDLLVEFQPGVDPDLFTLGGIQQDLCDLFNREVDLKTRDMFSPVTLQRILRSARLAYAA